MKIVSNMLRYLPSCLMLLLPVVCFAQTPDCSGLPDHAKLKQ
jgi:hypothetical protein